MGLEPADQDHAQERRAAQPLRRCALTRAQLPKDALIRFVIGPDGSIVPDIREKLPGRGVWLTAARETVAEASRRNVFARALKEKTKVPEGLALEVEGLLVKAALSALAMANKAGAVVFGAAKVEEAIGKGRILALIHAREAAEDGCRKLDGKARARSAGGPIPTVLSFSTDELGLASGRTNVIHAALIQGGAARTFLAAASRVERYRKGRVAFESKTGPDTDKE